MDWGALVIGFLQPLLLKCFEEAFTDDPQEYLRQSYENGMRAFPVDMVVDAIPQTRRAVLRARRTLTREQRQEMPRYSQRDLYMLTEEALIKAMEANPDQVAAVRAAAQQDEEL
jgi:uncharacterized protein YjcR